jgi:non-ribosomal peptide synthetase component F
MLQAFLTELDVQSCGSLRQVMCSGETLLAELVADFFAQVPEEVQLHNLYGPTEASIDVTFWQCQRTVGVVQTCGARHTGYSADPVPIGHPIANTQIYLLDRNLEPVPIGVTGELYIGGEGLARSYTRRPELTSREVHSQPIFYGHLPTGGASLSYR